MYAWTTFAKTVNEWGRVEEWINPGDEVSQADFEGMSDEDWQALIDAGSVREEEYPDVASGQSPAEYYQEHPDDAPAIEVDETTTQPEATAEIDAGLAAGMKMPVEEGAPADVATQEEQHAEEGNGSSDKPADTSSGGGTPSG